MPLNKPLLRKIARFIRKFPHQYRQNEPYGIKQKNWGTKPIDVEDIPKATMTNGCHQGHCGCIFGLAVALTPVSKRPKNAETVQEMGAILLGLERSPVMANNLYFGPSRTPENLERLAK